MDFKNIHSLFDNFAMHKGLLHLVLFPHMNLPDLLLDIVLYTLPR